MDANKTAPAFEAIFAYDKNGIRVAGCTALDNLESQTFRVIIETKFTSEAALVAAATEPGEDPDDYTCRLHAYPPDWPPLNFSWPVVFLPTWYIFTHGLHDNSWEQKLTRIEDPDFDLSSIQANMGNLQLDGLQVHKTGRDKGRYPVKTAEFTVWSEPRRLLQQLQQGRSLQELLWRAEQSRQGRRK